MSLESSPEGLVSKAGLQQEQELLNKDRGQKRRKTQAALVHWKELLQKVNKLEEELAKVRQESKEEMALGRVRGENGGKRENSGDPEKCGTSKFQELSYPCRY